MNKEGVKYRPSIIRIGHWALHSNAPALVRGPVLITGIGVGLIVFALPVSIREFILFSERNGSTRKVAEDIPGTIHTN